MPGRVARSRLDQRAGSGRRRSANITKPPNVNQPGTDELPASQQPEAAARSGAPVQSLDGHSCNRRCRRHRIGDPGLETSRISRTYIRRPLGNLGDFERFRSESAGVLR